MTTLKKLKIDLSDVEDDNINPLLSDLAIHNNLEAGPDYPPLANMG